MKKLVCLFLIVAVVLTMSLSSALAQEKVSLEIWSNASGMPADDANVILPAIEEATGLDLEWNVFSNDYDVSLNVRLGSGDFPDIFQIPYNMIGACLKQDVLLDVSTIWDQLGDVAAVYSDSDYAHMFYSGEMCVIPVRQNLSFNIRKDWLDNLGMEIPKTLDDLYDVLYCVHHTEKADEHRDREKAGERSLFEKTLLILVFGDTVVFSEQTDEVFRIHSQYSVAAHDQSVGDRMRKIVDCRKAYVRMLSA